MVQAGRQAGKQAGGQPRNILEICLVSMLGKTFQAHQVIAGFVK